MKTLEQIAGGDWFELGDLNGDMQRQEAGSLMQTGL